MTNLTRKLLTIYLVLGIIFFAMVIYLFVKNEILPEMNSDVSHKIRLTTARVIKNNFFDQKLGEPNYTGSEADVMAYNSVREKWKSNFLLVNEIDNLTYAKSTSFQITYLKAPFSIEFQDDPVIPLTTLSDKYKLNIEEDGKLITSFKVPKLDSVFSIDKKYDTVTQERTVKLISTDKRIILYLIFTID